VDLLQESSWKIVIEAKHQAIPGVLMVIEVENPGDEDNLNLRATIIMVAIAEEMEEVQQIQKQECLSMKSKFNVSVVNKITILIVSKLLERIRHGPYGSVTLSPISLNF
jgi:hypothetical protein